MTKKKIGAGKIGCIVVVLVFLVMAIGIYRLFTAQKPLPEEFVLKIDVSGDIRETVEPGFSLPFERESQELSLKDIIFLLDMAGDDKRIKGVLLDINGVRTGSAKIQQIQRAIERTRETGKRVDAFLRNAGDQDVWLASACEVGSFEVESVSCAFDIKLLSLTITAPKPLFPSRSDFFASSIAISIKS